MARKRLSPATMVADTRAPETKSFAAPPIAQVGAEAATTAALRDVTDALQSAKDDGRMLERLPLEAIQIDYLIRDRIGAEEEDMDALAASLRARGQTTPIEVTKLPDGRYGLISGWRRMMALKRLSAEGHGDGAVLARIVSPRDAQAAYVAMVEENEIRVNLTPYERAHIVVRALGEGLYDNERAALQDLYGNVSRSKRSKIGSLVSVVRELGDHLRFPRDLSERLGMDLSKQLSADPAAGQRLRDALGRAQRTTATEEAQVLSEALSGAVTVPATPVAAPAPTPAPAKPKINMDRCRVTLHPNRREMTIQGVGFDEDLVREVHAFVAKRLSQR